MSSINFDKHKKFFLSREKFLKIFSKISGKNKKNLKNFKKSLDIRKGKWYNFPAVGGYHPVAQAQKDPKVKSKF